jgi:hypothetical protein
VLGLVLYRYEDPVFALSKITDFETAIQKFAFIFFPGVIAGRLFDYGYFNHELLGGTILLVVATILAAECYTYWQFVLCQGLAIGASDLFIVC